MPTISQLLHRNKKGPPGDIGLEIELEFPVPQQWDLNEKLWGFSKELSVRNHGYEIVSNHPLDLAAVDHVVPDLCENLNKRHPIDTTRTSVHVHINQMRSSILQVLNCTVAYWLLETPLTRFCGEEREGHHFCLRLKDAEAVLPVLCESLDSKTPLRNLGDKVRYAGLNLSALNKFGSLEFRTMRGTTDPGLIVSWMKGLHHLCSVAKTFETPAQVFDRYLDCNKEVFIRQFLPKDLADAVVAIPGHKDMMDESASIVCALAYAKDNWLAWEKSVEEKMKAKKAAQPDFYGEDLYYGTQAYLD